MHDIDLRNLEWDIALSVLVCNSKHHAWKICESYIEKHFAVPTATTVSLSYAQTCQSLWVERNSYYKAAGYCFHTPRAIRHFGNAGCRFDEESAVPLSRATRKRIAQIVRAEQRLGCSE
jgi:hypothetical protein